MYFTSITRVAGAGRRGVARSGPPPATGLAATRRDGERTATLTALTLVEEDR